MVCKPAFVRTSLSYSRGLTTELKNCSSESIRCSKINFAFTLGSANTSSNKKAYSQLMSKITTFFNRLCRVNAQLGSNFLVVHAINHFTVQNKNRTANHRVREAFNKLKCA